jgi:hypothetical protein
VTNSSKLVDGDLREAEAACAHRMGSWRLHRDCRSSDARSPKAAAGCGGMASGATTADLIARADKVIGTRSRQVDAVSAARTAIARDIRQSDAGTNRPSPEYRGCCRRRVRRPHPSRLSLSVVAANRCTSSDAGKLSDATRGDDALTQEICAPR